MTSTEAISLSMELMHLGQATELPEYSRMVLILSHLRAAGFLDVQTFLNATEEVRDFYERHIKRQPTGVMEMDPGGKRPPTFRFCDVCREPIKPHDMQTGPPPPACAPNHKGPVVRTGPGGDFTKDWPVDSQGNPMNPQSMTAEEWAVEERLAKEVRKVQEERWRKAPGGDLHNPQEDTK